MTLRTTLTSLAGGLAMLSSGATHDESREPVRAAPPAYVTDLAEYDFEDGLGGGDPQGWMTLDRTTRPDTFTHVDDFAGLDTLFYPLEGTKSLWFGARPSPELCSYANLPGYGNRWYENFESVSFVTSGDVTLSYTIRYDTENNYDFVDVDYRSKTGTWREIASYDGPLFGGPGGSDPTVGSHTVPADSLDGAARFRFQFRSDGAVSDQDGYGGFNTWGAAVLDSITVSDDGGVVDYQDFEAEAVGARATLDGNWQAGITEFFGDFGGLVDGDSVLQEDTVTVNTSHFWSFFNGSSDTYACAGHPEQLSIPILPVVGYTDPHVYIANGAASPIIDLTIDKNGFPVPGPPDQVSIEYDVYADLVPNNWVLFNIAIKTFVDGCLDGVWRAYNPNYAGENKAWRHEQTIANLPANATHVQVLLYAVDYGWHGIHTCNSHAPLFDNVTVQGYFETASGVPTTPTAGYTLHANVPNPFNPITSIDFDVPPHGGEARVDVFDVSGRWVTTLTNRWYSGGTHGVQWNGRDARGAPAASGVYFCRLRAPGVDLSRKMVLLK